MTWHKKSFVKFILKLPLLYNSIDRYVQTLFLVLNSSLILLLSYKHLNRVDEFINVKLYIKLKLPKMNV